MSSTKKSNAYFCTTCGAQATKPACKRDLTAKNPALATLGTWTCPNGCKDIKVRRESSSVAKKAA